MSEEKMVKVTLAVSRVGPHGSQNRGDVIQVSAAEAKRMLAEGQIEKSDGGSIETAATFQRKKG